MPVQHTNMLELPQSNAYQGVPVEQIHGDIAYMSLIETNEADELLVPYFGQANS